MQFLCLVRGLSTPSKKLIRCLFGGKIPFSILKILYPQGPKTEIRIKENRTCRGKKSNQKIKVKPIKKRGPLNKPESKFLSASKGDYHNYRQEWALRRGRPPINSLTVEMQSATSCLNLTLLVLRSYLSVSVTMFDET